MHNIYCTLQFRNALKKCFYNIYINIVLITREYNNDNNIDNTHKNIINVIITIINYNISNINRNKNININNNINIH